MGMVVRTNTNALNANRQLGMNNTQLSKNIEKLSSGFKINRAADDASGLAISEKMKAQIKGLETASANSQDGISLIQTAEGALTEVHDMLNRMTELATKSANGTIQDDVDRQAIQREVDDLNSEITRIAQSTNFNGINLLDGSLSAKSAASSDSGIKADQLIKPTGSNAGFAGDSVDAEAALHAFDAAAISTTANFDAYTVTYRVGEEVKSFTLVEGTKGAMAADELSKLATALSGTSAELDLADPSDTEALANYEEFKKLFDVTGADGATGTGYLKIQAKEAGGADLVGISTGSDANAPTAAVTASKGAAAAAENHAAGTNANAVSAKAEVAGYELTFAANGATPANGDTVTINGKTYEFVTNANTKPANGDATAIVIDGSAQKAAKNFVEQLKKDGFDVKVSNTDDTKVLFTKPEQLKEVQKGAKVESASENVNIDKQYAVAGSKTVKFASATVADATLSFQYTDANGKLQTKKLDYKPAAATGGADSAAAIMDALQKDTELSQMFTFEQGAGGADEIKITSRTKGTDAAQFVGMTSDDNAAAPMVNAEVDARDTGKKLTVDKQFSKGDTISVNGKTYEFVDDMSDDVTEGNTAVLRGDSSKDALENLANQLKEDNIDVTYDRADGALYFNDKKNHIVEEEVTGGLTLQVGDTDDDFNKVTVSVDDLSAKGIGTDGLDVSNQISAGKSIDVIKKAINQVSTNRANLGALQNRLEHTINNLDTTAENMTSANSRVRDTDMAKQMMEYTKVNVLSQSAQAMLAQANQQPQSILQLLQ